MLVFLIDPEEELPQIKRDRSISEMVADKLMSRRTKRSESVEKEDTPGGDTSANLCSFC